MGLTTARVGIHANLLFLECELVLLGGGGRSLALSKMEQSYLRDDPQARLAVHSNPPGI